MSVSWGIRNGAVVASTLSLVAIVCGFCATENAFGQQPSWHSNFNQGTSAGRAWTSQQPSYHNSPAAAYRNRMSQGASAVRRNQESMRQSMSLPRQGNYRTYADTTPRRATAVTGPSRSRTSAASRSHRRWFGRRR